MTASGSKATSDAPDTPPTLGFLTALSHRQLGAFGGYLILNLAGRPLEFHCTTPVRANRAQEILYGPTLQDYLYGEVIAQTLLRKSHKKPAVVFTDRKAMLAVRSLSVEPVLLVAPDSAGPPASAAHAAAPGSPQGPSAGGNLQADPSVAADTKAPDEASVSGDADSSDDADISGGLTAQDAVRPTAEPAPRESQIGEADEDTAELARGSTVEDLAQVFVFGINRLCAQTGWESDQQLLRELLPATVGEFDLAEPFERIREAIKEAQGTKAA